MLEMRPASHKKVKEIKHIFNQNPINLAKHDDHLDDILAYYTTSTHLFLVKPTQSKDE